MAAPKKYHTEEERLAAQRASKRRYQARKRKDPAYKAKRNAESRDWYYKNTERSRVTSTAWKVNNDEVNREKSRVRHAARYAGLSKREIKNQNLKRYGMTIEDYERMLEEQGGKCKICECDDRKLFVDHNHKTGKVRGLICHHCNAGIGLLNEDPELFRKAVEYLRKHKLRQKET